MSRLISAVVVLGVLAVVGCGGGSSPGGGGGTPSSAPLAGKIGGKAWTFVTGESNATLSDDKGFWVEAYSSTFTPCMHMAPFDGDYLILTLPKTAGTYSLGLSLTQTFYVSDGDKNLVATSGTIVIDAVTATSISGALKFSFNADNSVDGTFTAAICP